MKNLMTTAVAIIALTAIHTATAADASRYSSKAALLGRRTVVTAAPAAYDASYYSSRAGLVGTSAGVTVAVLPKTSAQPAAAPHATTPDDLNTKKALR